ncbi:MAG: hypothetical protein HXY40_05935 [Chloroflexi bacterium]|nr:hypothetical protein [Chloroflexota bacterium]
MSGKIPNAQPLWALPGLNSRLEVYTDRVVIRHTDMFSRYLPQIFGGDEMLPLAEISGAHCCESRGHDSPWVLFVITMRSEHKHSMAFQRRDYKLAQNIKTWLDTHITKTELSPIPGETTPA